VLWTQIFSSRVSVSQLVACEVNCVPLRSDVACMLAPVPSSGSCESRNAVLKWVPVRPSCASIADAAKDYKLPSYSNPKCATCFSVCLPGMWKLSGSVARSSSPQISRVDYV
jgi:hypothetical protein